ncbi:MAG: hypothetical protein AAF582_13355, partial [Pseudomonadota bacterium]
MLILKYQRARRALLAASTLVLSAMPTGLAAAQDADTAADSDASAVTRLDTVVITAGRREQA